MAQLRALLGPLHSQAFPLGPKPVVIGRDPKSDLVLPFEGQASRHHAEVKCVNGEWKIRDLASRNGTLVNGLKVAEHTLKDEDEIMIGDHVFIFEADGNRTPGGD